MANNQALATTGNRFISRVAESYLRAESIATRITTRIRDHFCPPPCVFTDEEIEEYMAITYLSKEEIIRAYSTFVEAEPQFFNGNKNPYLPRSKVFNLPEFKVNPFRERMMDAVSTYQDYLMFEDYLEMMSILSEHAPIELKAEYAFRIYDWDHDDLLSLQDLVEVLKCLTAFEEIDEEDLSNVAAKALLDGDVDCDGHLAYTEFIHLVKRLDDFKSSFMIHA